MIWKDIEIHLSEKQKTDVRGLYQQLVFYLEGSISLDNPSTYYRRLKEILSDIINSWNLSLPSGDKTILNFIHNDNNILNLPWSIALYEREKIN